MTAPLDLDALRALAERARAECCDTDEQHDVDMILALIAEAEAARRYREALEPCAAVALDMGNNVLIPLALWAKVEAALAAPEARHEPSPARVFDRIDALIARVGDGEPTGADMDELETLIGPPEARQEGGTTTDLTGTTPEAKEGTP